MRTLLPLKGKPERVTAPEIFDFKLVQDDFDRMTALFCPVGEPMLETIAL
jgi:hypothetical protein